MSVTCGFYNSLNHDRKYDATQMSSIFDGIIKDGVFMSIGTHLTVTAGEGMFVTVGEGKAWFNHTWTLNDAELPLAVEVAELVLDRIDAVVLEVDSSEAVRDNSIKIIKGTPSSEPVNPVMKNTDTLHQYPLAYIHVKANVTEITTSDITNVIGTENTPFITGILETVNIDSLIAQWKSQWNDQIDDNQREYDAWLLAQQTSFVTWREEEESAFEAWFENLRNQLDENQAANLQNQIDGIKDELKVTGGSKVIVTIDDKEGTYNVAGLFVSLAINGIEYSSLVGENKIAIFSGIVETGIAEIKCYDNMQYFSARAMLEIPYYGRYEVTAKNVYMYEQWLLTAGYTLNDYPTVAYVLADEKAVRKLMTVHASCDAFVNWYNEDNSMLSMFTVNRVAMKWIGLRDYIADKLMSIPSALEQLLASEHWEYILKDKVPKMTSNTSPEGKCIANSEYETGYASKAFDRSDESYWLTNRNNNMNDSYIGYEFEKPIMVKKAYIRFASEILSQAFTIQASNDGKTWHIVSNRITSVDTEQHIVLDCSKAYKKYIVYFYNQSVNTNITTGRVIALQFYGRSLNESIPVMTSNTAPLGVASASSVNVNGNCDPWYAFSNDKSTRGYWECQENVGWIQYEFKKPILAKLIEMFASNSSIDMNLLLENIQASNNGIEFETIYDEKTKIQRTSTSSSDTTVFVFPISTNKAYKFYRFNLSRTTTNLGVYMSYIQIFGVSYSEEEFGSDGIEMLYDNGVKFDEFVDQSSNFFTELDDYIECNDTNANAQGNYLIPFEFDKHKNIIYEYSDRSGTLPSHRLVVVSNIGAGYETSSILNVYTNKSDNAETISFGAVTIDCSALSGEKYIGINTSTGCIGITHVRKLYVTKA